MPDSSRVVESDKVWASLVTNMDYVTGLLTLHHSLVTSETAYPFVALYTDSLPERGRAAIAARGIPLQLVPYLSPSGDRDYSKESRFADTWSKLAAFSLIGYQRVVLLDSDMLVRKNMDELMDLSLDDGENTNGSRVLAAGHACTCNPLKKAHYPATWVPSNCPFTSHHADPNAAQSCGIDSNPKPLGVMNSGLLVIVPSVPHFTAILDRIKNAPTHWVFPDQELLADLYRGRWVGLPYVYDALKTLRWKGVHDAIWREDEVKNVHYIFCPKPWDDAENIGPLTDETHKWWWAAHAARKTREEEAGIADGW